MAEDNGKDMALKDNFGAKKGELNQGFTDVPCMTDQQERYKDLEPVPYEWPPKEDGGFLGRAKGEER